MAGRFFSKKGRWLVVLGGLCLVVVSGVYGVSAVGRGSGFGCVPLLSANESATGGYTDSSGFHPDSHGQIDSVLASTANPSVVYVTTADRQLFVGSGSPVVWSRRRRLVGGELKASLGKTSDTLYAAGQALYRSLDQGRTWHRLTCGLPLTGVAISRLKPSTIYLAATAADQTDGPFHVTGGLYRSTDGGRTWRRFTHFPGVNPDEPGLEAVAVSPTDPREVVVAPTQAGVLVSGNGGGSWRSAPAEGQVGSLAFSPGSRPQLWLGTAFNGVFRADQTARHWRRTRWPQTGLAGGGSRVIPDQTDRRTAYALSGVRRTIDNGAHWTKMSGLPGSIDGLDASARDGTLYAWAGRQIFRSRDHGATWRRLTPLPTRRT
jgi:hypothetical protein